MTAEGLAELEAARRATARQATDIWAEQRQMPGETVAEVRAYVVPLSGVGWVDFEWRHSSLRFSVLRSGKSQVSERRRLVADWDRKPRSEAIREVIALADKWFAYCHEQAEREEVVAKLASGEKAPPDEAVARAMTDRTWTDGLLRSAGYPVPLPAPDAGQQAVESVLPSLTGQAALGTPEGPRDGLGDLGDDVAEAEVGT